MRQGIKSNINLYFNYRNAVNYPELLIFPGVELQNKQALGSLPRKVFYTYHTFSENVSYPYNTFRLIFQPTAAPL